MKPNDWYMGGSSNGPGGLRRAQGLRSVSDLKINGNATFQSKRRASTSCKSQFTEPLATLRSSCSWSSGYADLAANENRTAGGIEQRPTNRRGIAHGKAVETAGDAGERGVRAGINSDRVHLITREQPI
jgi:hypothetical protein